MRVAQAQKPSIWSNESHRYTPLDEILAMPRTRILRTLTHFDRVSLADINLALDNFDNQVVNAHTQAITRLVAEGAVERIDPPYKAFRVGRVSPSLYRYRITQLGRDQLRALLSRAAVTEGVSE